METELQSKKEQAMELESSKKKKKTSIFRKLITQNASRTQSGETDIYNNQTRFTYLQNNY